MSISHDISFWDLFHASRYLSRRSPVFWLSAFVSFLSVYNAASAIIWKRGIIMGIITFCVILLAVWVFFELIIILFSTLRFLGSKSLIGEYFIALSEEGIRVQTKYNDALLRWTGIKKVTQNKRQIIILIDGGLAHIIPKKSFSTLEEMDLFFRNAMSYWKSNKL